MKLIEWILVKTWAACPKSIRDGVVVDAAKVGKVNAKRVKSGEKPIQQMFPGIRMQ